MKRILVFIDWFLPGSRAGGPVRSLANLVDFLHAEYDFFILTRNTDYCSNQPYSDIKSNEWIDFKQSIKIFYTSQDKLNYRNFKEIVKDINPDLIYATGIYSFYFSLLPVRFGRLNAIPTVVAPRGMMSQQSFSSKSFKKKLFYAIFSFLKFYRNVRFHATSEGEVLDIKSIVKNNDVVFAQNFPRKQQLTSFMNRKKGVGELRLVAMSRISPEKNVYFAIECLKACSARIILDIYGTAYDEAYFKQCKELASTLPDSITVNFKQPVPTDDVLSTIQQYHFSFSPTTGENFGHSILESFAAHTPVVISNRTPWLDLSANKLGFDLPLEHPEAFVETLNLVANLDDSAYQVYVKSCADFIVDYYAKIDLSAYRKLFEFKK